MNDGLDLAGLLSIWPIAESFATYTSVGDLITLARTTSSLRSSLHGQLPEHGSYGQSSISRVRAALNPGIGRHQTRDWAHLKAIASFTCSSAAHVRGNQVKPCVYCSKPICTACIVRDSFKHRKENTFKNRLRYFCRDCYSEGRRTRSFRFPATSVGDDELAASATSLIGEEEDKPHLELDEFCICTLKDHGWLCQGCKEQQNDSSTTPSKLTPDPNNDTHMVECYGLECENSIDLDSPDKDRRRICLWCQKPLRRQWGGEDRFAWNLKTIEARARNAEIRSRDIEEYNRNRMRVLRMSRNEMRRTSTPGDSHPIFVRHLDVFNYRNWMTQESVPDPEQVWNSKKGVWRHRREFMFALQKRCRNVTFTTIGNTRVGDIQRVTRQGVPSFARLNKDMYPAYRGYGVPKIPEPWHADHNKRCLNELKVRVLTISTTPGFDAGAISDTLKEEYGVKVSRYEVELQLDQWRRQSASPDVLCQDPCFDDISKERGTCTATGPRNGLAIEAPTPDEPPEDTELTGLLDNQLAEAEVVTGESVLELLRSEATATAIATPMPTTDDLEDEEPPPYVP